jgi:hypothetical protein
MSGGTPYHEIRWNVEIPRRLFHRGLAVIGHTVVHKRPALKFTLCIPCTTPDELSTLVEAVVNIGIELTQSSIL